MKTMMRPLRIAALIAASFVLPSTSTVQAELTSEQEALTIAGNYISLVLINEGNWGGAESAEVVDIQEFKRGERTLGYFCQVHPQGFLVLSLHKELAPVKAYSVRSNLDPEFEAGMTDLLKDRMEGILAAVEEKLGRPLEPDDMFADLLEINCRAISDALTAPSFNAADYREPRRGSASGMNYQEGEVLLTSDWHQGPPYNDQCPDMGCDWSADYDDFNHNAVVGCVATAAAQVMRHWRWPPRGILDELPYVDTYDWPNMCDEYNYNGYGWFNDENGDPVTSDQINAVAELCAEIGLAVDMDWGCGNSSVPTSDMEEVYESPYWYDVDACVVDRDDYSALEWFGIMKQQFNVNRPVQYRIPDHSIAGDGWKEEWIDADYYWYHMNYGWVGTAHDTWYALDELYDGDPDDEYMISNIVPSRALEGVVGGSYPADSPPYNYRYFDRDASGVNATFDAGQLLQILRPGFLLSNTGSASDSITFYGTPDLHTRLFLSGDPDTQTRILIKDGALRLRGGGGMVVH